MQAYLELTKPRITALIVTMAAVGFFFGRNANAGILAVQRLLETILGVGLLASGTAALNQWYESGSDARMRRTAGRPIPSGRIGRWHALVFGLVISIAGFCELLFRTTPLAAWLGVFTLVSYLVVYTPLKKRSWLSTAVGAVPGAMPPLIGFAAARGTLSVDAWVLAAILFVWQFPHFYAIAWMYREDYANAGIRMLPVIEPDGRSTTRQMVLFAALLVLVGLLPYFLHIAGPVYAVCSAVLGLWLLHRTVQTFTERTRAHARAVLISSVIYLPAVFIAMVLDSFR